MCGAAAAAATDAAAAAAAATAAAATAVGSQETGAVWRPRAMLLLCVSGAAAAAQLAPLSVNTTKNVDISVVNLEEEKKILMKMLKRCRLKGHSSLILMRTKARII